MRFLYQGWKKYYKEQITGWVFNLPIVRNIIRKKIDGNFEKVDKAIS
mgnify:CR=1 FL=1|jgi:hypothetical protein